MDCPACHAPVVAFAVPADLREHLPSEETHAALCTRCLRLHPAEEPSGSLSDLGEAFPTGEAGVPMAIAVGLLDSLALNRTELAALIERVERAGVDPYLVIDRLARSPDTDPAVDLVGRRQQLEQLL